MVGVSQGLWSHIACRTDLPVVGELATFCRMKKKNGLICLHLSPTMHPHTCAHTLTHMHVRTSIHTHLSCTHAPKVSSVWCASYSSFVVFAISREVAHRVNSPSMQRAACSTCWTRALEILGTSGSGEESCDHHIWTTNMCKVCALDSTFFCNGTLHVL